LSEFLWPRYERLLGLSGFMRGVFEEGKLPFAVALQIVRLPSCDLEAKKGLPTQGDFWTKHVNGKRITATEAEALIDELFVAAGFDLSEKPVMHNGEARKGVEVKATESPKPETGYVESEEEEGKEEGGEDMPKIKKAPGIGVSRVSIVFTTINRIREMMVRDGYSVKEAARATKSNSKFIANHGTLLRLSSAMFEACMKGLIPSTLAHLVGRSVPEDEQSTFWDQVVKEGLNVSAAGELAKNWTQKSAGSRRTGNVEPKSTRHRRNESASGRDDDWRAKLAPEIAKDPKISWRRAHLVCELPPEEQIEVLAEAARNGWKERDIKRAVEARLSGPKTEAVTEKKIAVRPGVEQDVSPDQKLVTPPPIFSLPDTLRNINRESSVADIISFSTGVLACVRAELGRLSLIDFANLSPEDRKRISKLVDPVQAGQAIEALEALRVLAGGGD